MQDIEEKDTLSSDDVGRLLTVDSLQETEGMQSDTLAIGTGEIAKAMIETADDRGIRIRESPSLVNLMLRIDRDKAVPEDMRRVMDTMLTWVMKICDS